MWFFTEEQKILKQMVANFAKQNLAPYIEKLDEEEGFNKEAFKKMGELGLLGITVPEKDGGTQMGCVGATIAMEEMGAIDASTTLSYLAHSILFVNNLATNGNEEQKRKYLPKVISGEWIGGMGMTEPEAGTDALNMSTQAVKKNNKWVLNGSKMFITNSTVGDVFYVYAKTGPDKKDISTFIVEKNFPGFKVGKKLKKMGMRASPTGELIFENCEVPEENLVGKLNGSLASMIKNLDIERITIAGISLGIARASIEVATKYATERKQFGTPISQFQMIQERLAEAQTQYEAACALVYNAAKMWDEGLLASNSSRTIGAKAKLFSAQMATQVALDAIQILGGYGYIKEFPVERYMRDAKLIEIGAGTNEILRVIIARELFSKLD
jgi:isovaleryl-CoA dehydrogenase